MFTLIRGVIIVGLIFYFSPARETGKADHPGTGPEHTSLTEALQAFEDGRARDNLWARIVGSLTQEVVRTAVNQKAEDAGTRLKDQVSWSLPAPFSKSPAGDRDGGDRASPGQSVRCIYRCDGAE